MGARVVAFLCRWYYWWYHYYYTITVGGIIGGITITEVLLASAGAGYAAKSLQARSTLFTSGEFTLLALHNHPSREHDHGRALARG